MAAMSFADSEFSVVTQPVSASAPASTASRAIPQIVFTRVPQPLLVVVPRGGALSGALTIVYLNCLRVWRCLVASIAIVKMPGQAGHFRVHSLEPADRTYTPRHPEVLAASCGEPRRMATSARRPSFETPRKRAAPQDDGGCVASPLTR